MVGNSEPAQQHPRGGGANYSRQERGSAPSGSHDDFFDVLSRVLSAMEGAVEAFHIIGDEDKEKGIQDRDRWGKRPQLSAVSKKRMVARTLGNLKGGVEELTILRQAGKDLQGHYFSSQQRQSEAEQSREEVYLQLQSISGAMQDTSMKLHRAEEGRLAAVDGLQKAREKTEALESKVKQLEEDLKDREAAVQDRDAELQSNEASVQRALQDAEEAVKGGAEAREREAEARRDAEQMEMAMEKARGACARHQEAVAKLTADNLMFMMRMNKAEAEAEQLRKQRDELRQGLEFQQGPWFDTVRAGVEQQVSNAMRRANELEALLEQERASAAEASRAAEAQRQGVEEVLRETEGARDGLQEALERQQDEAARLRGDLEAATQETREERRRAETAEAEVRVLNDSMKEMRHECQDAAMRVKQVNDLEGGLRSSLEDAQRSSGKLEAALRQQKAALEVQTQMNRELMSRKQEVEWQLMTAMARVQVGAEGDPAGQELSGSSAPTQEQPQEQPESPRYAGEAPAAAAGDACGGFVDAKNASSAPGAVDPSNQPAAEDLPSPRAASKSPEGLRPQPGASSPAAAARGAVVMDIAIGMRVPELLSLGLMPVRGTAAISSRVPAAITQTSARGSPQSTEGAAEELFNLRSSI